MPPRLPRRVRPVQVACSLQTGSQPPEQRTSYQDFSTGPGEMENNAEERSKERDRVSIPVRSEIRYTCHMKMEKGPTPRTEALPGLVTDGPTPWRKDDGRE